MTGEIVATSEVRDGMHIDWDLPVTLRDGTVLRADVYRPEGDGRWPVILAYGPYGKGHAFQDRAPGAWERMVGQFPEIERGTSGLYQVWETVDPERWVPDGYACVRVDLRGSGRSPGHLDMLGPQDAEDCYDCIEWAGEQPWSSGKVAINGISYLAMIGWLVAPLRPPHLAAVCAWEASADFYREFARHGGILSDFMAGWFERAVTITQHGMGERGPVSRATGEQVAGPPTLGDDELAANRSNPAEEVAARPLLDDWYTARIPALEDMSVPLLSAANWGGQGLHNRGNFEGFLAAGSAQKWLEAHGNTHFAHFYTDYGVSLQKQFLGHFLKGEDNGWHERPPVLLNIRRPGERFELRGEHEWPLARTRWTRFHLDPDGHRLTTSPPQGAHVVSYAAAGDGVTFSTPPLTEELEITGPAAAKLWIASDTADADVFVALRVFDPDGHEVTFIGSNDPRTPIGLGWLRASHRKLDAERSLPHRPFHTHDEPWPLAPGEPVELDVEIWPTCIVVPIGYRIAVTIRGCDYEVDGDAADVPHARYAMRGVGPFTHTDPADRPPEVFDTTNHLHVRADAASYVLLPVIP